MHRSEEQPQVSYWTWGDKIGDCSGCSPHQCLAGNPLEMVCFGSYEFQASHSPSCGFGNLGGCHILWWLSFFRHCDSTDRIDNLPTQLTPRVACLRHQASDKLLIAGFLEFSATSGMLEPEEGPTAKSQTLLILLIDPRQIM